MADAGGVVYLLSSYQSGKERLGGVERGGLGVEVGVGGRYKRKRRQSDRGRKQRKRENTLFWWEKQAFTYNSQRCPSDSAERM